MAQAVERKLFDRGCQTMLLDGDMLRHGLCGDLGFSAADRSENIRRVGEMAKLFFESGHIVLCAFISPFEKDRAFARSLIAAGRFFEIYAQCSLETCKARDPKGLYKKAEAGEIPRFTGISSPYEEPNEPELIVRTDAHTVEELTETVFALLRDRRIMG